jgi:hypothetical protein
MKEQFQAGGPKARPKGVADGKRVNSPVLLEGRYHDGVTQEGKPVP